ncbi:hypothetical protein ACFPRL_04290 [Pseudoclavibacter helvolus]
MLLGPNRLLLRPKLCWVRETWLTSLGSTEKGSTNSPARWIGFGALRWVRGGRRC